MNSVSSMLFCYIGLRPKYILRMNQVDSFRSGLIQTKPRVYTFNLYSLYHCSCVVVKRFTEEDDVWFLL